MIGIECFPDEAKSFYIFKNAWQWAVQPPNELCARIGNNSWVISLEPFRGGFIQHWLVNNEYNI